MSLLLKAGDRVGDYCIVDLLGRGGMGVVYRATQVGVGRQVALKLLSSATATERAIWRLRREARLLAKLAHPGVVAVFDAGIAGATPYYAMELVEGTTLRVVLDARKEAPTSAALLHRTAILEVLAQVAEALACAHAAGIVHRDVKPGNILLHADGRARLADFGLAIDAESKDFAMTGELVGTPYYMSPEQVRGEVVDHRSDVYSLGIVLYEALTGERPFEGATAVAVMAAIADQAPPPLLAVLPAVSGDCAAVVRKAMARAPGDRYQSAGALAADLRAAARGQPVSATPPGVWRQARAWLRREPWRVGALLLCTATVLALLLLWRTFHLAVQAQGQQADVVLVEVNRLALGVQLDRADVAARDFVVARPGRIEAMQSWLRDHAQPLIEQVASMRQVVEQVRQRALPYGDAEATTDRERHSKAERLVDTERAIARLNAQLAAGASALSMRQMRVSLAVHVRDRERLLREVAVRWTWRFARHGDQLLHDQAAVLAARLERFALDASGTVAQVRERLEWAEICRQRCLIEGAGAWRLASEEVAADQRLPGLHLQAQDGLLPLGRDPTSGLQEFVHLRSGTRDEAVPQRDALGHLVPTPETGIVFVLLPGGNAVIGAQSSAAAEPNFDPLAQPNEQPVQTVRLAPFFVGKYEVTRGQWSRLTGGDWPSKRYGAEFMRDPLRPVDSVALARAREVFRDHALALPTEAQWEYACRASTTTAFSFGERAAAPRFANFADLSLTRFDAPWNHESDLNDSFALSAPVGSLAANPFGLHDVHGNVAEWCDDPAVPYTRPTVGGDGRRRLISRDGPSALVRGGSYSELLAAARSASRGSNTVGPAAADIGMRAARPLDPLPP